MKKHLLPAILMLIIFALLLANVYQSEVIQWQQDVIRQLWDDLAATRSRA